MGWIPFPSYFSSSKASDGGSIAPDRSSRDKCWLARDRFFDCLDENDILDAIKDRKGAQSKCPKELKEFEGACSETWAKYFKEKRVMERKREQSIERIKREEAANK